MADPQISDSLTFKCRVGSLKASIDALAYYSNGNKQSSEWLKETSQMPIFLDTNLLLNIYDISQRERDSFIKFLDKNKKRILLSSQVRREYLRHRVLQIRGVQGRINKNKAEISNVLDKTRKDIEGLKGAIKGVTFRNIVKYGMPKTYENLKQILDILYGNDAEERHNNVYSLSEQILNATLEEECNSFQRIASYMYDDPILKALNSVTMIEDLTVDEQKYIVSLYKSLRTNFDAHKDGWSKDNVTFPGSGDAGKPIDGPIEESVAWADLYIYCQMLKYMKSNDCDVLFITHDVSKGDWLVKGTNEPFIHYIENAYEQTGRMMYIKNSDDYLPLVTEQQHVVDISEIDALEDDVTDEVLENEMVKDQGDDAECTGDGIVDSTVDKQPKTWQEKLQKRLYPKFRKIDKASFMTELHKCNDWANSYGAGYVSRSYFIFDILGQKHYEFTSCLEVLDELQAENKVKVVTENHDGRDFECLQI